MRRLPLAVAIAALAATPAAALAASGTTPNGSSGSSSSPSSASVASPFKSDRSSSKVAIIGPTDPSQVFDYPDQPVVLSWRPLPGAASYKIEIADNSGFTNIVWTKDTDQTSIAPDTLFVDGSYWWRVTASDAAGTAGIPSEAGRFSKAWPNQLSGLVTRGLPTGPESAKVDLQPYLFWNRLPGASNYDVQIAPADQFAQSVLAFWGTNFHSPFATPAVVGVIHDDNYQWRVRARDPKGSSGPWSQPVNFQKAWVAPKIVSPLDNSLLDNFVFQWQPLPGAESYQIEVSDSANNWDGTSHLVISGTTNNAAFVPQNSEMSKPINFGNTLYWRVRATVDGVTGPWSTPAGFTVVPPAVRTPIPVLTTVPDQDTALDPVLTWTAVSGASVYRIDLATDAQFTNIVEKATTQNITAFIPRNPLPDNQVGPGYHWRVLWGTGTLADPDWQVLEQNAPTSTFRKQTRVVLGLENGAEVATPPLLSWDDVPGAAKYDVQIGPDRQFDDDSKQVSSQLLTASIYGLGVTPGSIKTDEKRLSDGTWFWRVRPVNGAGKASTWSPARSFTLTSPAPTNPLPADGTQVVGSPLLRWDAAQEACSYIVQVKDSPALTDADASLTTPQTALEPTGKEITHPGVWYWRVRADYCDNIKGTWSPIRSFTSLKPPAFVLDAMPKKIDFGRRLTVTGALTFAGAGAGSPSIVLERRGPKEVDYTPIGTITGDNAGHFSFPLAPKTNSSYRLRWLANAAHPEAQAGFQIQVAPRVRFALRAHRVARRGMLRLSGSVSPARTAVVQALGKGGWLTVRTLKLRGTRFNVGVRTTLDPGRRRIRLVVPGDERFASVQSQAESVMVFDRFVVRRIVGRR